ncbi:MULTISPECIES: hypothetical protein, partial [unclassified Streptomyces]|uniref:hypothetical protein n=1 Tax=unclassified Streptomyces TaxID=2593676 RepID=UPI001C4067EB
MADHRLTGPQAWAVGRLAAPRLDGDPGRPLRSADVHSRCVGRRPAATRQAHAGPGALRRPGLGRRPA